MAFSRYSKNNVIVKKFDGTNWVQVGTTLKINGNPDQLSLRFESSKPQVAVAANGKITVVQFITNKWDTLGAADFNAGQSGKVKMFKNADLQVFAQEQGDGKILKYNSWTNIGSNVDKYEIYKLTQSDTGTYRCVVSNDFGSVVSNSVKIGNPKDCDLPTVTYFNGLYTEGCLGDTTILRVAATKATSYQWQKDVGGNWVDITGKTKDTLIFSSLVVGNEGMYRCKVSNSNGDIYTTETNVHSQNCTKPIFTQDVVAKSIYCQGEYAYVQTSAKRATSYTFQKKTGSNWNNVGGGGYYYGYGYYGYDSYSLFIHLLSIADTGYYRCAATNNFGTTYSNEFKVSLQLCTPPDMLTNPQDLTSCIYERDSSKITAGRATSYQWEINVLGWRLDQSIPVNAQRYDVINANNKTYVAVANDNIGVQVYQYDGHTLTAFGTTNKCARTFVERVELIEAGTDLYYTITSGTYAWPNNDWWSGLITELFKYNGTDWVPSSDFDVNFWNNKMVYKRYENEGNIFQCGTDADGNIDIQQLVNGQYKSLPYLDNVPMQYNWSWTRNINYTKAFFADGFFVVMYVDQNHDLRCKNYSIMYNEWQKFGLDDVIASDVSNFDVKTDEEGTVYLVYTKFGKGNWEDYYKMNSKKLISKWGSWQDMSAECNTRQAIMEAESPDNWDFWGHYWYPDLKLDLVRGMPVVLYNGSGFRLNYGVWEYMPYNKIYYMQALGNDGTSPYGVNVYGSWWRGTGSINIQKFDTYQGWKAIKNEIYPELKFTKAAQSDTGYYRCVATNQWGSTPSNKCRMDASDCRMPQIKWQPHNECYNHLQSLWVDAELVTTYQWQKKVGNTFQNMTGYNDNSVKFPTNSGANYGVYRCSLTNKNGTVYTDTVVADTNMCKGPEIVTDPVNTNACIGSAGTFNVTDKLGMSYQWWKLDFSSGWSNVGSPLIAPGFTWFFDVAMEGSSPIVAFGNAKKDDKLSVKKYDVATYSYRYLGNETISDSSAYLFSIAMKDKYPYVAYSEGKGRISVKKFDGAKWTYVGTKGISPYNVYACVLKIEGNNIYLGYIDNNKNVSVLKFDGTNWNFVGSPKFAVVDVTNSLKRLDLEVVNDVPYISYRDANNSNKAAVKKFDGSAWVYVGSNGVSSGAATDVSMCMKGTNPIIAFADVSDSSKVSVYQYNGTTWSIMGTKGISSPYAENVDIQMGYDNPYIAYNYTKNGSRGWVKKYDGSSWKTYGDSSFSKKDVYQIALRMSDNLPYVGYLGKENNIRVSVKMLGTWEMITNGTSKSYSVTSTTKPDYTLYRCLVMNNVYGVYSKPALLISCITDVNEIDNSIYFTAYPNPANNNLILETDQRNAEYILIDAIGQTVGRGVINGVTQINVDHLAGGVYFVKLLNSNKAISISVIH